MKREPMKPLRMPLATGATAFKSMQLGAMGLPGIALVVGAVFAIVKSFVIFAFLGVAGGLFCLPLGYFRDARRQRASDVILDDDGLAVRGGPYDGHRQSWASLDPSTVVLEKTNQIFSESEGGKHNYLFRLRVAGMTLAESAEPNEIASLQTLRDAMLERAAAHSQQDAASSIEPAPPGIAIESCSQCGAPLVPRDADDVACIHCGAVNAVPAQLRESIRAAAEADGLQRETGRQIARALTEGGAVFVNYALLAFPFACSVGGGIFLACAQWNLRPLFAIPAIAIPLASAGIVKILVARRFALQGLTAGCAALTPRDPTQAPMCRRCRAPLPASDDPTRVIVTCVYCQTANVLGISRTFVGEAVWESIELENVMNYRQSEVRKWTLLSALSVAATLLSGLALLFT